MSGDVKKIWLLSRTEYAGQCTGYSSETVNIALFEKKPTLAVLAPFLDPNLPDNMGAAIAALELLLGSGYVELGTPRRSIDYNLDLVQMNVRLDIAARETKP